MSIIDDNKLETIKGGTSTLTSTMVNAFTNIIKILFDAGRSFGSSFRRISENNLCPLD